MPADADVAVPDFHAWAQQVQAHIDGRRDALSIARERLRHEMLGHLYGSSIDASTPQTVERWAQQWWQDYIQARARCVQADADQAVAMIQSGAVTPGEVRHILDDAYESAQPGDTAPSRLQHLNDALEVAFHSAYDRLVIGTTDRGIDRPGWRSVRHAPSGCASPAFPADWDNIRIIADCMEHIHASLGADFCGDILVRWAPALAVSKDRQTYRLTYALYVRE